MSADDGRDAESAVGTNGGTSGETDGGADEESTATQDDQGVNAPPPPPPVRKPLPVRGPANPALLGPSAEELAADQPSVETLRRVRRALRALPEPD